MVFWMRYVLWLLIIDLFGIAEEGKRRDDELPINIRSALLTANAHWSSHNFLGCLSVPPFCL